MSLTKATYSMISGSAINIIDFGADSAGSLDSTSAFQAAADSGAKHIYVPNGTYLISSGPVTLSSNQTWEFSGVGLCVIKSGTDADGSKGLFLASSKNNISFVGGVTLDGNMITSGSYSASGTDRNLLKFSSCTDITIKDVEIKKYSQHGVTPLQLPTAFPSAVLISTCDRVNVENIYQHDCWMEGTAIYNCENVVVNNFRNRQSVDVVGAGVSTPLHVAAYGDVTNSAYNTVTNFYTDGSNGTALEFMGVNHTAENITALNAGSVGIDFSIEGLTPGQQSKNIKITNAYVTSTKSLPSGSLIFGIYGSCSENCLISGCTSDGFEVGIYVGDTTLTGQNVIITNNTSTNCRNNSGSGASGSAGILVRKINGVRVANNYVNNSDTWGVNFRECFNVVMSGNTVQECDTYLMFLQAVDTLQIANNIFDNSAVAAFSGNLVYTDDSGLDPTNNIWFTGNYFTGTSSIYAVLLGANPQNVFSVNNYNNTSGGTNALMIATSETQEILLSKDTQNLTYRMPIRIGTDAFLWVSSDGKLRIKSTHPTSDADGTVVGTQT